MKLGESTGGRPPYVMEDSDIKRVLKLASFGYSKKAISQALNIDETTFYDIEKRDSNFSQSIKNGIVDHCLRIEELYEAGDISPTQYIYWSKTKWRSFYPQEIKEEPKQEALDFSHLTDDELATLSKIINKPKERG